MSAAQGWDRNRRRGGGAAGGGGGGGGGGSGASGGSGGSGGRGTGQLNRFVQLSGRPHLPGKKKIRWDPVRRRFIQSCPIIRIPNRFLRGHRPPPARSGHRCVADNTNLYVFGGYNPDYDESGGPDNEDYPLFRELWRYHFATGVWHQMGTDGYMPRELASMSLVLHGNNLLVFGGTGIPFGESNGNDVHVCNVKYKRWALLSCRGKKPSRIYGQAMAIINGSLYVFGGTTGYIYSTDLHKLDLNTREWTQLKPNNLSCDLPEERYRHEIAHDGQRIYILGGGTSWTAYSLNKIHAYNLETNAWEEIATKPHEKIGFPAARRCHSCVQIKNDVFICGGYNGEVILGDIWKLNLQTFQWVKLPATMPEPVYFHCAAVTPAGCMYIHGGVVNIHENKRTGSLFKIWLVVPSLLELAWEKLLAAFPNLANLSRTQLLHLGLTQGLIERLK
ncbi:kelch domain-containing protein 10 isoform X1 [Hippopotamus amphibius kiboko]|uniref:kelch domain-containing protein 10 isoform X1 n=1 Tax=Hippopotamus amphibius kiboko TaxID=575201 RepID=UPI0025913B2D|nr:kelch domain-containing protein 10 isoform X1 [Hippopotamus amphibius kiboko]